MLDNEFKLTPARFVSILLAVAGLAGTAVFYFLDFTKIDRLSRDNDALQAQVQELRNDIRARSDSYERGRQELTDCKQNLHATPSAGQAAELAQCNDAVQYVRTANATLSTQLAESAEKLKQSQAEVELLRSRPPPAPAENTAEPSQVKVPPQKAKEIEWETTASDWRNNIGQSFAFYCPPGGATRQVQGDQEYSTGSSICTAAAHAGKITVASGGAVVVRILGVIGVTRRGTTKAGIKSSDVMGQWDYSMFAFE